MSVPIINTLGPILRRDDNATMTVLFSSGETVHVSGVKIQANSSIVTATDTSTNKPIHIDATHVAAIKVD